MNNPPGTEPAALPAPVASSDERHPNARDHPHCRANLSPRWRPGQSGNPSGRRANSWTPADYLRFLQGPEFTAEKLHVIWKDPDEPVGKRAAARMQLSLLVDANSEIEERVEARRVFQAVNDRLEGTPTQSHRVVDESVPDVVTVVENLRAELVGGDRLRIEAGAVGVEPEQVNAEKLEDVSDSDRAAAQ